MTKASGGSPEAKEERDSKGKETARLRSFWAATEDVAGNPHDTSIGHDPGASHCRRRPASKISNMFG